MVARGRFRCPGLRATVLVFSTVRHPSVDDTVGGEARLPLSRRKRVYNVLRRSCVNPCQTWYVTRCLLKGPVTTKLPSPCSARRRSFNCTLTRPWMLSIKSDTRFNDFQQVFVFRTWLYDSALLFVHALFTQLLVCSTCTLPTNRKNTVTNKFFTYMSVN